MSTQHDPSADAGHQSEDDSRPFYRRRLFQFVAGVFLLAIGAVTVAWLVRKSEVDSRLAALRAQGQPTTVSELNDFYRVPDGVADTTDLWVMAIDSAASANLSVQTADLPFVGKGNPPPTDPLKTGRSLSPLERS